MSDQGMEVFSIQYDYDPEKIVDESIRDALEKDAAHDTYNDFSCRNRNPSLISGIRRTIANVKNKKIVTIKYSEVEHTIFANYLRNKEPHDLMSYSVFLTHKINQVEESLVSVVKTIASQRLIPFYSTRSILQQYADALGAEKRKILELYVIYVSSGDTYTDDMEEIVAESFRRVEEIATGLSELTKAVSKALTVQANFLVKDLCERFSDQKLFPLYDLSKQIQDLIDDYNSENPRE